MVARLKSDCGEKEISIELCLREDYAGESSFLSSISLKGTHFDGDDKFPFSAHVEGLWLCASDLIAFRNHISGWLHLPQAQLIPQNLDAKFNLARLPSQTICIQFGKRPDVTSSLNPVIAIEFSAGTWEGEFHFVTDQSCLGLFIEALSFELMRLD